MCLITQTYQIESAEYQLSNEDDNVKQLRKKYLMISLQKKAPKLILKR
ncbi:Csa1 family protein [Staphylococcus epidermidis]